MNKPVPKIWLVQRYGEKGWPANVTAQIFTSYDDAAEHARTRAIASPGMTYVLFEPVKSWRVEPAEPTEETL
jgi:hypothetical protein